MAKILIIDDDKPIQDLISQLLCENGHEVATADNGQEGFSKAIVEKYDLITCDLKMPKWRGEESIFTLDFMNDKTPIIVISGFLDKNKIDELNEFEMVVDIIHKPFDVKLLFEKIKEIIG